MKKVEVAQLSNEDYIDLLESMKAAYPSWGGGFWQKETISKLIEIFPEGQLAIKVNDKPVGCALSIVVNYEQFGDDHTYSGITGDFTFSTHTASGDTLYGIEVFIHPDYRGLRLGRRLYDARKELCEQQNLRAIIFGGRLPNYHNYSDVMTPKQYISKVKMKEIYDPVLTFQLSNDFHVKKILTDYMPEDAQSMAYATLLQWHNIFYKPSGLKAVSNAYIRIGLVQWQMRLYKSLDEMFTQIEFFIDSTAAYKADFAVMPEFFNAPLMADYNHLSEAEAFRMLAQYTDEIKKRFKDLAIKYNVNIITGSFPELVNNQLFNVGYLCHRNGKIERYEKIHITPDETKYWGIRGGSVVKVFDTDCGKVGILICYDVEFPELGRILADQGMQILFVPFLTDTQNAYMRVRCCAQARAIENECFVAITGSVGNLPKVKNMDIQYSQAAVFTPSDFAFPSNAVKAEATTNTEMVLIADVDLRLLSDLHHHGSVRNLKNRRKDLYKIDYNPEKKDKDIKVKVVTK